MTLTVAIVGRPNVGKSTLFNRLAGKKIAIVDDQPGVTRDRKEAPGTLGDLDLKLIDTAGFEDVTDASLEARMRRQTEVAIAEADVAIFLYDARAGVTPLEIAFWHYAIYYGLIGKYPANLIARRNLGPKAAIPNPSAPTTSGCWSMSARRSRSG